MVNFIYFATVKQKQKHVPIKFSIFILQSAFPHLSDCHLLVTQIESWPLICDFPSLCLFLCQSSHMDFVSIFLTSLHKSQAIYSLY